MTATQPQFSLLGPLSVSRDGKPKAIGGQKPRALLAALLLEPNRVVSRDSLIDALWGEAPPDTAHNTIQVYVSQLRKLLPDGMLETAPPGYRLIVDPETVDLFRFVRLCEEGRTRLADGDAAGAAETLRAALDLWRGAALADLAWEPFAHAEIGRASCRESVDLGGRRIIKKKKTRRIIKLVSTNAEKKKIITKVIHHNEND